ncbi:MAG: DUF167 domain-containing protein [Acidimicrobiales bacterium]|jgi:uncharacterized protein YggU (UPF0235/DUF167 family)
MRLTIRVRPGASSTEAGGRYGDGRVLVVRVQSKAVDGRATDAALRALAEAFGVSRADVALVTGARARTKIVQVEGDGPQLERRLDQLLAAEGRASP